MQLFLNIVDITISRIFCQPCIRVLQVYLMSILCMHVLLRATFKFPHGDNIAVLQPRECCYIVGRRADRFFGILVNAVISVNLKATSSVFTSVEPVFPGAFWMKDPASNPDVLKLRSLVTADPRDGWNECWKEGITPWDLGKPTPVISHLIQTDSLPKGRVLVPGCGTGYDVVAIAGPDRYVVGLDISETAVQKSESLFSSSQNANYYTFVVGDFFTWRPNQLFDLICDYTFFCAMDPSLRSAWASQIQDLLAPDGELLTIIYPIDNFVGGPPFAVSLSTYKDVLGPVGFLVVSVDDNVLAVGPRKGREQIARWKRSPHQSSI